MIEKGEQNLSDEQRRKCKYIRQPSHFARRLKVDESTIADDQTNAGQAGDLAAGLGNPRRKT